MSYVSEVGRCSECNAQPVVVVRSGVLGCSRIVPYCYDCGSVSSWSCLVVLLSLLCWCRWRDGVDDGAVAP